MKRLKGKLLGKDNVLLPSVDIWISDWRHGRTGRLNFPLHRSIEISRPHFIELENGEKKEISITRIKGTERTLIVGFKIKNGA